MKTLEPTKSLRGSLRHLALAVAVAAGLSAGSAQALTFSLTGNGTNGFVEWGGEADGYKFTTLASPLEVSWLGFYDAPNGEEGTVGDDLLASHRVSIWRESDGVLMAQTTVEPGDTLEGNFRGRSVTLPVTLAANTAYVIAADFGGEGDRMQQGNDLTGWGLNGISIQAGDGRYNGAGGGMPTNPYDLMISANFGYTLAPLSVSLTSPLNAQAYETGTPITATATVLEPGAFTNTVTFHVTPTVPPGPTVETDSLDAASPFTAALGALADGTYEIYATTINSADPAGTATSATHTFTVESAVPTTTVLAAAGPATTYGDNVTFTATVEPAPTGGTVQFFDGEGYLGDPVAVIAGVASISTTALGAGTHEITAQYSGYQIYETSTTAASISQDVGQAELTVTATTVIRQANTANPDPLPYAITGYKNGQNLATSGATGTPVLTTDATLSSPVGNYVITCTPGTLAAPNYSFTLVNGTLTVSNLAGQLGVLNLNANGGINPATGLPWALGDTYRLVFVTSGTTTCDSPDIATYNAFVQGLANASTAFPALGSVTWKVVGSTATVAARDNTDTNPGEDGTGVPILRMDGTFVIANNYADLWDGINNTHVAGENYLSVHLDENGVERIDERVRTGSSGSGTAAGDGRVLGGSAEATPRVQTGRNFAPDFYGGLGGTNWMADWSEEATSAGRVYAMSGILTIVSTTPTDPYQIWLGEFTFAEGDDTTLTGDPDGDGMSNQEEFAFGLNPTLGSSVNPIVTQLDPVTGNFQYTRRATPETTGLTYTVLTSTTLAGWAAGGATETGFTTAGNIETVTVNVTSPPVDGKLFVRVEAAPTP